MLGMLIMAIDDLTMLCDSADLTAAKFLECSLSAATLRRAASGVSSASGATLAGSGTDSPVSMEASTAEVPATTTPSVAIFSPGRTTNSWPAVSCSTGILVSTPSRRRETSLAPISSSDRRAEPACWRERASIQRPSSRKEMIATAASK